MAANTGQSAPDDHWLGLFKKTSLNRIYPSSIRITTYGYATDIPT